MYTIKTDRNACLQHMVIGYLPETTTDYIEGQQT